MLKNIALNYRVCYKKENINYKTTRHRTAHAKKKCMLIVVELCNDLKIRD